MMVNKNWEKRYWDFIVYKNLIDEFCDWDEK